MTKRHTATKKANAPKQPAHHEESYFTGEGFKADAAPPAPGPEDKPRPGPGANPPTPREQLAFDWGIKLGYKLGFTKGTIQQSEHDAYTVNRLNHRLDRAGRKVARLKWLLLQVEAGRLTAQALDE